MRGSVLRYPRILAWQVARNLTTRTLAFFDGVARPKWVESIRIGIQDEFLTLNESQRDTIRRVCEYLATKA